MTNIEAESPSLRYKIRYKKVGLNALLAGETRGRTLTEHVPAVFYFSIRLCSRPESIPTFSSAAKIDVAYQF